MTDAIKYPVKDIYPKFKCLTPFRRSMNKIRNAGIRRDNRKRKFDNPSGLMFELTNYLASGDEPSKGVNRNRREIDWAKREQTIKIIRNNSLIFQLQRRSEYNFDKKVEFYQSMISRDYKTVTLCDDVIGVIFEFLPKYGSMKLSKSIWALLYK